MKNIVLLIGLLFLVFSCGIHDISVTEKDNGTIFVVERVESRDDYYVVTLKGENSIFIERAFIRLPNTPEWAVLDNSLTFSVIEVSE